MNTVNHLNNITITKSKCIRWIFIVCAIVFMLSLCCSPGSYEVVEPETQVHYKLERFGTYARLYLSYSDRFGSDYIEFNHTAISFPEIYFIEPDTLYFIDNSQFYFRHLNSDQFVIKQINLISSEDLDSTRYDRIASAIKASEIRDSIRSVIYAKPRYTIWFFDYATGIMILNPQKEVVAKKKDWYVFRGS